MIVGARPARTMSNRIARWLQRNRPAAIVLLTGATAALVAAAQAVAPQRLIAPDAIRSGLTFASSDVRSLQADEFRNPGMLWVDRGAQSWSTRPANGQQSCQGCHGDAADSMKGVAAHLPKVDPQSGKLRNLEASINACRTERQHLSALEYESQDMLGLASFVAHQSRGLAVKVQIDAAAQPYFDRGRALYFQRMGQMNLACTHCHDQNWSRRLLTEPITQGHSNAYPIYRIEWQTAGSLHRRFRSCLFGVRAEMWPQGADEYLALELYLAWRGEGLPIETPGVRR
jgi:L-cysteine S-thiosulfotransferase